MVKKKLLIKTIILIIAAVSLTISIMPKKTATEPEIHYHPISGVWLSGDYEHIQDDAISYPVSAVAISDETYSVIANKDTYGIDVYNNENNPEVIKPITPWIKGYVNSLSMSENGVYFAAGLDNGYVRMYSRHRLICPIIDFHIPGDDSSVYSVSLQRDGLSRFLVAGTNKGIFCFDRAGFVDFRWWYPDTYPVHTVSISNSTFLGRVWIAAGDTAGKVMVFKAEKIGLALPYWTYSSGACITKVAISSDGSNIVAGNGFGEILYFNRQTNIPLWTFNTSSYISSIAVSSDGDWVVVGTADSTLYLFNSYYPIPIWTNTFSGPITSLSISENGDFIGVTANGDNKLFFFSRLNKVPLWTYSIDENACMAMSRNGKEIVVGTNDHYYYFRDQYSIASTDLTWEDDQNGEYNTIPFVLKILHDPNGDGSNTYYYKEVTNKFGFSLGIDGGNDVQYEIDNSLFGIFEGDGIKDTKTDNSVSSAFSLIYTTSEDFYSRVLDEEQYIGPRYGDVYIIAACNLNYKFNERDITCSYGQKVAIPIIKFGLECFNNIQILGENQLTNHYRQDQVNFIHSLNIGYDNKIDTWGEKLFTRFIRTELIGGGIPHNYNDFYGYYKSISANLKISLSDQVISQFGLTGENYGVTGRKLVSNSVSIGATASAEKSSGEIYNLYFFDDDGNDEVLFSIYEDKIFGTLLPITDLTSLTSNPVEHWTNNEQQEPPANSPPYQPAVICTHEGTFVYDPWEFEASTNDPDSGDTISYLFDWCDGQQSSWNGYQGSYFWYEYGNYLVKVKAMDSYSHESIWSDNLSILNPKKYDLLISSQQMTPPTNPSTYTVAVGEPFSYQFYTIQNPEYSIGEWELAFGDGSSVRSQRSMEQQGTYSYNDTGFYYFNLSIYNNGTYYNFSKNITVIPIRADINVSSLWAEPNESIIFYNASWSNTPISNWIWNFGDNTTSYEEQVSHSYVAQGDYNVSLTVSNETGTNNTCSLIIHVDTEPQIIGINNSAEIVHVGEEIDIHVDVYDLLLNTTDICPLSSVYVNISYPDGSYKYYPMEYIGEESDIYSFELSFLDTTMIGEYNYTVWVLDDTVHLISEQGTPTFSTYLEIIKSPDDGATDVSTHPTLCIQVPDPIENWTNVSFYEYTLNTSTVDTENDWGQGVYLNTTTDGNGNLQLSYDESPYGTGSSGNHTISSGTLTIMSDMNYYNLTINPGAKLNTNGHIVKVRNTLTNYGTITDSNSGGTGGTKGYGGDGQDPAQNSGGPLIADDGECGQSGTRRGGTGGSGGAGGGGAKAQRTTYPYDLVDADGGTGGDGGNGGKGGGDVIIYAYILNNQGTIHADGGDGEDAGSGSSGEYYSWPSLAVHDLTGGGGGGGNGGNGGDGGFVNVTYAHLINLNISGIHANGGSGGTAGTGATGIQDLKAGYTGWNWWEYTGGDGCTEGYSDGGHGEYTQYEYSGDGEDGQDGSDGSEGTMNIVCQKYVTQGNYTQLFDAGVVVGWSNVTVNMTQPADTCVNISFGENTTGVWVFYEFLEQVPDCRWLQIKLNLSTTNISTTSMVDNVTIRSSRRLLGTVDGVADDAFARFNWTGLELNTTYSWQVRVFNDVINTFSPVWNFTTIKERIFAITNVSDSPDLVGFGYPVDICANVFDNDGWVTRVMVNVRYPDMRYGNFTMNTTVNTSYEYVLDDTWLVGQYNYTVWAWNDTGSSICSSGHSFNVSANATITVATLKDSYGDGEYINITDPPVSPEPQDWIIENNTIYFDTEKVYLSATPHTMKRSGWTTFELQSKQHSGSIDIGFGTDSDAISFDEVQIWKDYLHEKHSYRFEEDIRTVTFTDCSDYESLDISLYDEEEFDLGNDNNTELWRLTLEDDQGDWEILIAFLSKTIVDEENGIIEFTYKDDFWIETSTQETYWDWKTVDPGFECVEYIFGDMNTWYFHRDIDIVSDQLYTFRIWIDVEQNSQGKYWWVMKPHAKTIQEAIMDDQFYFLDPWWDVKHITTLLPTGDGNSTDWSMSPVVRYHYQNVDDDPDTPDTTTYVYTKTGEDMDRYSMEDILNGTNPPSNTSIEIQEVALFVYGRQGNVYIKPQWGTDYGSVQSLGNSWGWQSKNFTTLQNGSAITVSDVDAMIYELKKQGSQGSDCEVSAVYVEVAWNYRHPFDVNYSDEIPVDTSIGNILDDGGGVTTGISVEYWAASDVVLYESYTAGVSDAGSVYSTSVRGQTFAVDQTFTVVNISLELSKIGTPLGDLCLDVFDVDGTGKPTGVPLTSAVVDVSDLSSSYEWVDFLVEPYMFESGEEYAFVLNFSAGDSSNYVNWSCSFDSGGYADGEMLYSTDGGGSWSDAGEEADGLFRVYGSTGEFYDLSFLSNSSGSWVEYGTVRVVCNGSYSVENLNFSEYQCTYWWRVNASNSRGWDASSVFRFSMRNQSKINNTGSMNICGYLLIQVQYNDSGTWVVDVDAVNETFPQIIGVGQQLALDTIFNGLVTTSDLSYGNGTYRVYAAFRDPDGDILVTDDDRLLAAWYEFEVTGI